MRRRRRVWIWALVVAVGAAAVAVGLAVASQGKRRHAASAPAPSVTTIPPPPTTTASPAAPPHPAAVPPLVVTHGPRDRREIALTFDADMTPGMLLRLKRHAVRGWYDQSITAYLEATQTPATIFLTGLWAKTYARVVRSLAANPLFELENHSYDHYAFHEPCFGLPPVAPPSRKPADVTDAQAAIMAAGAPDPHYFRFPGGCHGPADVAMVASLGEVPVDWDTPSTDAFNPSPQSVIRSVLTAAQAGSIVIMHIMGPPNAPSTSHALRTIVPVLKARGYRFVTLRELLG